MEYLNEIESCIVGRDENKKFKSFIRKAIIIIFIIAIKLFLFKGKHKISLDDKNDFNILYLNADKNISSDFIYFKLMDIKYYFSFDYELINIDYKVGLFDNSQNLIVPPDLKLYKNLQLICFIEILNNSTVINSLADIYQNSYFKCEEIFRIKEKIRIGIKLYEIDEKGYAIEKYKLYLFNENEFDTRKNIFNNNDLFDPLIIMQNYKKNIVDNIINNQNKNLKLKSSYMKYPFFFLKRYSTFKEDIWIFLNIFNHYFCLCKGNYCFLKEISPIEKYLFYQYIIDNNRQVYNKTDYLFIDFIFAELSSDDAYPVFKEMYNRNLPVHYLTENLDIYNEYCLNKTKCPTIIYVNKNNYTINGNFIEKHLTLFLKLKQVISGSGTYFNYMNNLFYNIEYITYISVTHGVCFFKYFLYEDNNCYGKKRIDKLLIPPIDLVISLVKRYGWKDDEIIQTNLPRWDRYNQNSIFSHKNNNESKCIFLFFTWRDIKKNKKISVDYIKNIFNILDNKLLIESLKKKNITFYYTFHHKFNYNSYMNKFKKCNYMKFINENSISNYLDKLSLVITDFSSIVFDIIYRKKPFIIYIPDANDQNLKNIYTNNYYELIESFKNKTFNFPNIYFELIKTINKIIYYINTGFTLDHSLELFYNNIGFKYENNVNKFVEYLKNIN